RLPCGGRRAFTEPLVKRRGVLGRQLRFLSVRPCGQVAADALARPALGDEGQRALEEALVLPLIAQRLFVQPAHVVGGHRGVEFDRHAWTTGEERGETIGALGTGAGGLRAAEREGNRRR